MTATLTLTDAQVADLSLLLGMRGDHILIANIYPAGPGWALTVRAIPAERKAAIVGACNGTIRAPRHRTKNLPATSTTTTRADRLPTQTDNRT